MYGMRRRLKKKLKKNLAMFLALCMMATSFQGIAWADEENEPEVREILLQLDGMGIREAAQEAIRSGNLYNGQLNFMQAQLSEDGENVERVFANEYAALFSHDTGNIYMLDDIPYVNEASASEALQGDTELMMFVKLDGNAVEEASGSSARYSANKASDSNITAASGSSAKVASGSAADIDTDDYTLQGTEKVIFLFVNRSEDELNVQLEIDGRTTGTLIVESGNVLLAEEQELKDSLASEEVIESTLEEVVEPAGPASDEELINGVGEITDSGNSALGGSGTGSSSGGGNDNSISIDEGASDNQESASEIVDERNEDGDETGEDSGTTEKTDSEEIEDEENKDNASENENPAGVDSGKETSEELKKEEVESSDKTETSNEDAGLKNENRQSEGSEKSDVKESDASATENDTSSESNTEKSESSSSDDTDSSKDNSSESGNSEVKETEVKILITDHVVPRVMGPNPDAAEDDGFEDEDFEEWQDRQPDDEEEEEEYSFFEDDDITYYDTSYDGVEMPSLNFDTVYMENNRSGLARMARAFAARNSSVVSAGAMVMSINSLVAPASVEIPVPTVGKQAVVDTTDVPDGEAYYDVSLTVNGDTIEGEAAQKSNIVFVLDYSNSMADDFDGDTPSYGEDSKWDSLRTALNGFLTTLDTENNQCNISIIRFGSEDLKTTKSGNSRTFEGQSNTKYSTVKSNKSEYYYTILQDWVALNGKTTSIMSRIPTADPDEGWDGGTHSAAGYVGAHVMLSKLPSYNSQENNFVVYLTDGEPVVYVDDNGIQHGKGTTTITEGANAAKTQATALKTAFPNSKIYNVSITNSDISWMKESYADGYYRVNNSSGLTALFQELAGKASSHVANAVVTDILGENVEPVAISINGSTVNAPEIYLQTDANGAQVKLTPGYKSGSSKSIVEYKDASGNVIVEYEIRTKTLTWNTASELPKGETRILTYKVRVTGSYKEDVSDYPDQSTEDVDTGTHTGGKGYYSNESAVLSYSQGEDIEFPMPVVRPVEKLGGFSVQKLVSGDETVKALSYSFTMIVKKSGELQDLPTDAVVNPEDALTRISEGVYSFSLSDTEKITVSNLKDDYSYQIEENSIDNKYTSTTTATINGSDATLTERRLEERDIVGGEITEIIYRNTVEQGYVITVNKLVEGDGAPDSEENAETFAYVLYEYPNELNADGSVFWRNYSDYTVNGYAPLISDGSKYGLASGTAYFEIETYSGDTEAQAVIKLNSSLSTETKFMLREVGRGTSSKTEWSLNGERFESIDSSSFSLNSSNKSASAVCTNYYLTGSLLLKKDVVDKDLIEGAEYTFDVALTEKGTSKTIDTTHIDVYKGTALKEDGTQDLTGLTPQAYPENGRFTLKVGEWIYITKIPQNTSYSITEQEYQNYDYIVRTGEINNNGITITASDTASGEYTNSTESSVQKAEFYAYRITETRSRDRSSWKFKYQYQYQLCIINDASSNGWLAGATLVQSLTSDDKNSAFNDLLEKIASDQYAPYYLPTTSESVNYFYSKSPENNGSAYDYAEKFTINNIIGVPIVIYNGKAFQYNETAKYWVVEDFKRNNQNTTLTSVENTGYVQSEYSYNGIVFSTAKKITITIHYERAYVPEKQVTYKNAFTPRRGSIFLNKVIESMDYEPATFVFKISSTDGKEVFYRSITLSPTDVSLDDPIEISDVIAGDYKIEEMPHLRYRATDGTTKEVTCIAGLSVPSENNTAIFSNKKQSNSYFSDSSVITNKYGEYGFDPDSADGTPLSTEGQRQAAILPSKSRFMEESDDREDETLA